MRARACTPRLSANKNDRCFWLFWFIFLFCSPLCRPWSAARSEKLALRRIGALVCRHYRRAMRTEVLHQTVYRIHHKTFPSRSISKRQKINHNFTILLRASGTTNTSYAARNRIMAAAFGALFQPMYTLTSAEVFFNNQNTVRMFCVWENCYGTPSRTISNSVLSEKFQYRRHRMRRRRRRAHTELVRRMRNSPRWQYLQNTLPLKKCLCFIEANR